MTRRKTLRSSNPATIWLIIVVCLVAIAVIVYSALVAAPAQQMVLQANATATAQAAAVEQHYQAGMAFEQAEDWPSAAEELRKVIALDADYVDAPARLRMALAQMDADASAATVVPAPVTVQRVAPATPAVTISAALATAEAQGLDLAYVRVNPIDSAIYLRVPAGEFIMGSDTGDPNERPVHTVYLDEYWIMDTEVTNGQYARCVAAGACTPARNDRFQDPAYTDHPVTDVSWDQAQAYAAWAGGRLPTEAEWEKAARGVDGRTYPWGDAPPGNTLLNFNDTVEDTRPVGSYPAGVSPYGAVDMAGNVWEWTADWFDTGYYSFSPSANPTGPATGEWRVIRGGSWSQDSDGVRGGIRSRGYPWLRHNGLGFRLAETNP